MKNFLILSASFFSLLTFTFAPEASAQCPIQANVLVKTHTDISCFGANDGTITVDIDDIATSEPFNFELFDLGAGTIITLSVTETEVKANRSVVYSGVPPGTYAVLFFKTGCIPNPLTIIEPPFGFVIDEPTALSVIPTITPDCGSSTGQINIAISGGTVPYNPITWTGPTAIPNGTTSTAANLSAGTYTVNITDANGCFLSQNINVAITTIANAGPPTALVCGPNTLVLSANTAGPGEFGEWTTTGGASFLDDNDPNTTVSNLDIGSNTLTWTIRDIGLVCPGNSDNIIVTYSDVQINGTPDVLLDCFGDTDGTGTFTVTNGSANYTYSIIANSAGASITLPPPGPITVVSFTGAGAGLVTIQVLDGNGCTSQATINITQPTQVTFSPTQTNVSCFGGNNGTITVTAAGGTGPYEFSSNNGGSFTPGANPFTFTTLTAGPYNIVVRDANGCTTTATLVTITQPAAAVSFGTTQTNVSCFGGNNGTITVTAAGGTGPYEFSSNNGGSFTAGANPFTFTTLTAGPYNIVVRDANGCTTTATLVTITQPAAAVSFGTTQTNVSCFGGNNGTITVTAAGGTGPYEFSSNNGGSFTAGANPFTFTTLTAGPYNIVVRDANGCTTTATLVTITQPAAAVSFGTTQTNVSCFGGNNGTITVTAAGGTGPYEFSSNNGGSFTAGANPFTFTTLTAGPYNIVVRDANGCTTTATLVTITQPAAAVSFGTTQTNVSCFGGNNGTITVTAAGGTGPYEFSSNNGGSFTAGANPFTFTTLTAGPYNIVVRDANGCTTTATLVTITQPAAAVSFGTTQTNVSCFGGNNGTITVTAAGGTGPYEFSSNNGGSFTAGANPFTFTTLTAGPYNIVVRDANGCTTTATLVTITQPAAAVSFGTTQTNVSCFGGNNGTITVTAAGGTGPYEFSSNNGGSFTAGANPFTFTTLTAGGYNIVVRDANGCTTTATLVTITQPAAVVAITNSVTDNSSCTTFNGAIDINVTGTTGSITYDWTGPSGFTSSSEDITGLEPGDYDILVTDGNGCTASATITVGDISPSLTINNSVTDNTNCTPFNGAIDITVGGSAGPFTFDWTGPSGFTSSLEDITDLEPGDYDITVTDNASGCTVSTTITVNDISPVLSVTSLITDNTRCISPFDGAIDITVVGSGGPFTFDWIGPNGFTASSEDIIDLESGDYDLTVTDNASGCTVLTTISVNDNVPSLSIGSVITDNTRCISAFNGAIDITMVGSAGPFTFDWTGPSGFTSSSEDITNLESGDYNIDVTDNTSGCTTSALITVGDLTVVPSVSATVVDNDQCNAPFNGAILLDITPVGAYSFSWTGPGSFSSLSEDIINLASGAYQVTVTNIVSGCSTVENIVVNDNSTPVTINADVIADNSSCTAPFNGVILITASPAGTYTYSWTGPSGFTSSSEDISALRDGDYTVTATNTTLGCSTVQLFTVGDNTVIINITSQTIVNNTNCQAPFNGSITITAGGTVGPYQFDWTGPAGFTGSGASISGLQSGDYDVTITDLTIGCSDIYTLTVGDATPPITLTLDASSPNTSCLAPFTGSLSITASGTAGPYTFSWTGPNSFTSSSEDIVALENGDYDISVTDSGLGCVATATFTVIDGRPTVTLSTISVTDNTSCVAPFNGDLTVSAGGTAGPFTFNWSGPSGFIGTGTFNGSLEPGDYTITATDQVLGCETTSIITVPDSAPVVLAAPLIVGNSNCLVPFNGSIDVTVAGTPGPYSFLWSGPSSFSSTSEDISGLEAGDYDVQITDDNLGCTGLFTFNVPQNATTVTIGLQSSTPNSNCTSPFNGALDVTIGGTPGPYTISWTGPGIFSASSEDINSLASGNYTITVTDDLLGCTVNATFNVANIASGCGGLNCFAFTVTSVEQRPSCALQDDGSITFTVSGGTPNYIVTLTDGAGFNVSLPGAGPNFAFTNLSPADYTYIILDQAGNVCPLPYSLPIQTNVDADATGFVDVSCFGQPTGQATITVLSGGTSPYDYSIDGTNWVLNRTSPILITDLPPNGTYSILVRDDATDQCPDEVSVTISNTNPVIEGTFTVTDASCNSNNGAIDIASTTGGTGGAYSYRLDGGAITTSLPFVNLAGGNHFITMIDNSGCERDTTITVPFPGFVAYSAPATTIDATCSTKGQILIFIPNPPGSYEIGYTTDPLNQPINYNPAFYNPATGLVNISNLDAGIYYVWIRTSSAACPTRFENSPGVAEVIIGGPQPISFEIGCRYSDDDNDGLAVLDLRNISASSSDPIFYEIFGNGFQKSGTITPDPLAQDTIHGFATGDYIIWLRQDQTTFGCTVYSDTLSAPSGALDTLSVVTSVSFPEQPTGSIEIKIQESGFEPYEVWLVESAFLSDTVTAVSNPVIFEANFSSLAAGTYSLFIQDADGCRKEYEVILPVDDNIFVPNIFTPNNDGVNEQFYVRNLPTSGSKLSITNRWGKEVYSSGNYNPDNLWDGEGNPDGVYYYRLQVKDGDTYTGWVEILRGTKP